MDQAQQFLGWFMFVGFILYLTYIPYFLHKLSTFVLLLPVYTIVSLLVFPMYHHYVKLLTQIKKLSILQRIYIPAFVFGILMYWNLLLLSNNEMETVQSIFQIHPIDWSRITTTPVFLLLSIYTLSRAVFTILVIYTVYQNYRLIQQYQKHLADYYSDPENHSILSLNYLLAGMILTSIYGVVANTIGVPFFLNHPLLLMIPSITISILLFFFGYIGTRFHQIQQLLNDDEIVDPFSANEIVFGELFVSKFQRKVLDDKAYLISGIKITTLCEILETNRTYLSVYINKTYQCNYSSLINKLRIEYSIQQLNKQSIEKYSMNYLSEICGFSSINTFYRTFQKEYGMTPGQYIKLQENETPKVADFS